MIMRAAFRPFSRFLISSPRWSSSWSSRTAASLSSEGFDPGSRSVTSLAWLGRDDYSASDWSTVREEAARAHNERTANYLLGTPLVGDFLEEGLSMLGYSCEEFEIGRL